MNSYGYDYYVPNDNLYYDETSYLESIKPLDKIENFENDINDLVNDTTSNNMIDDIIDKKNKLCQNIYSNLKKCQYTLRQKSYELQQSSSHIFILYVLLIFAIVFVFYQKMKISNLINYIYILKYNRFDKQPPISIN